MMPSFGRVDCRTQIIILSLPKATKAHGVMLSYVKPNSIKVSGLSNLLA
jgi:hypothetical protein